MLAGGCAFGALFGFISASEQLFRDVFAQGDTFALWFAGVAFFDVDGQPRQFAARAGVRHAIDEPRAVIAFASFALMAVDIGHGVGPMGSRTIDEAQLERLLCQDTFRIWALLKQVKDYPAYSRLVILAQGGYGKTTLLRHVAYIYATGRHKEKAI